MRRFLTFLAIICSADAVARADSFQVFDFNASVGATSASAPGTASGTLTLDTSTGLFTSLSVLVFQTFYVPILPSSYLFTSVTYQGQDIQALPYYPYTSVSYLVTSGYSDPNNDQLAYGLILQLPVPSLAGYTGSAICAGYYGGGVGCGRYQEGSEFFTENVANDYYDSYTEGLVGTLTPTASSSPVVTPEPSSLGLLGTGLVGLGLMVRSRRLV